MPSSSKTLSVSAGAHVVADGADPELQGAAIPLVEVGVRLHAYAWGSDGAPVVQHQHGIYIGARASYGRLGETTHASGRLEGGASLRFPIGDHGVRFDLALGAALGVSHHSTEYSNTHERKPLTLSVTARPAITYGQASFFLQAEASGGLAVVNNNYGIHNRWGSSWDAIGTAEGRLSTGVEWRF